MSNHWNEIKLTNSRLLYIEDDYLSGHWQKCDEKLFHFIETNPKLRLYGDRTILYFFADTSTIWVGREVVGHVGNLPSEFEFYDVNKGMALEVPLQKMWFDLNLGEVHHEGLKNLQEISKQTQKLATTWRLVFDWSSDVPKIAFNYFFLI